MMDEIQGDDPIESKAVVVKDEETGSRVPMILTAFEEEGNQALDDAGYRGRFVMFALIDGGVQDAFTDPYKSNHHTVGGDVERFITHVKRGWETHGQKGINWSVLEHGGVYDALEISELTA